MTSGTAVSDSMAIEIWARKIPVQLQLVAHGTITDGISEHVAIELELDGTRILGRLLAKR